MTDQEQLDKAMALARSAHEGQTDRGGNPYWKHLRTVAEGCNTLNEKTVAWLHDIIEDTWVDENILYEEGFSSDIVCAVSLLTKRYSEEFDYKEYLSAIKENPLACTVKKLDLAHNMDTSRLKEITEKDRIYQKKYRASLAYLNGETEEEVVFPPEWSRHMDDTITR